MDLNRISELLRKLTARQEKVVRLYYGLGCQRTHSTHEIAQEFGVSPRVIAGLLAAAERRLAREGLTSLQLREAVGLETAADCRKPSVAGGRQRLWHRRASL